MYIILARVRSIVRRAFSRRVTSDARPWNSGVPAEGVGLGGDRTNIAFVLADDTRLVRMISRGEFSRRG